MTKEELLTEIRNMGMAQEKLIKRAEKLIAIIEDGLDTKDETATIFDDIEISDIHSGLQEYVESDILIDMAFELDRRIRDWYLGVK